MNPILTAACRTKQALNSAGKGLKKTPVCEIAVSGRDNGALDLFLDKEDCKKLLILSIPGEHPARDELVRQLQEQGRDYALWDMKEPLRLQDVENIRLFAMGEGCDGFAALGEPWLLCAGKLAALRMAQKDKTAEALMTGALGRKRWPLVVIPTAPKAAAVSDEVWAKDLRGYWLRKRDPAFVPGFCLLDPAWMPAQSREEHIEQSLALLALCLEEALDPREEESRPARLVTVEDILKDLRALAEDRFEPREEYYRRILESALWQGGYAAALAEEAAQLLEISKGRALAAILPALLNEYWKAEPQTVASLEVMTVGALEPRVDEEEDSPFGLPEELRSVFAALGLPEKLPALTAEQSTLLAEKVAKRINGTVSCPLVLGRKDLRSLLTLCSEAAPAMEIPAEEEPVRRKALAISLPKRKEKPLAEEAPAEHPEEDESASEKDPEIPEKKPLLSRFKRKKNTEDAEELEESPAEAKELPPELVLPEE